MMNGTIEKAAVELPSLRNKNGRGQARSMKGSVARTGAILMCCAGNLLLKPTAAAAIPDGKSTNFRPSPPLFRRDFRF